MKPLPNAIELWAEEVEKCKFNCKPLNEKQSRALITCSLGADKIDADKQLLELVETKKAGYLSAFWLRIKECHTYKITLSAALFLSEAVITTFGISTMLANYLQWAAHTYKMKTVDINFICMQVFPMGFPSSEQWSKLWDLQKLDRDAIPEHTLAPDNILDYASCGETIRSI